MSVSKIKHSFYMPEAESITIGERSVAFGVEDNVTYLRLESPLGEGNQYLLRASSWLIDNKVVTLLNMTPEIVAALAILLANWAESYDHASASNKPEAPET